jgi:hypothetical protein
LTIIQASSGSGGNGLKVQKNTPDLGVNALGHLHGFGVQSDLAGQVNGIAGPNGLGVGADRLGGMLRFNQQFHDHLLKSMEEPSHFG